MKTHAMVRKKKIGICIVLNCRGEKVFFVFCLLKLQKRSKNHTHSTLVVVFSWKKNKRKMFFFFFNKKNYSFFFFFNVNFRENDFTKKIIFFFYYISHPVVVVGYNQRRVNVGFVVEYSSSNVIFFSWN